MKSIKPHINLLFIFLCSAFAGFILGRSSVSNNIKQEPITAGIDNSQLEPISEEKPLRSFLPVKYDTIFIDTSKVIIERVDTAAIIAEYELKRSYSLTAFDNKQYGKLQLRPVIQHNKLSSLDYDFTPSIQRPEKVWTPFVSGSYSTFSYIGLGGGLFYHNLGFEYQYQISLGNMSNEHLFGLKYKF